MHMTVQQRRGKHVHANDCTAEEGEHTKHKTAE